MPSVSNIQISEPEPQKSDFSEAEIAENPATRIPDGLVRADQLPSAAEVLAQLFPADEPVPTISPKISLVEPAKALDESHTAQLAATEASAASPLRRETTEAELCITGSAFAEHPEHIDQAQVFVSGKLPATGSPVTGDVSETVESAASEEIEDENYTAKRRKSVNPSGKSRFAEIATRARNFLRNIVAPTETSQNGSVETESPQVGSAPPLNQRIRSHRGLKYRLRRLQSAWQLNRSEEFPSTYRQIP